MNNRWRKILLLPVLVTALAVMSGCGAAHGQDDTPAPVKVTVSIIPQQYFVERIGGERVDVTVMVLPGQSPATYEPKPEQLAALSESAVYFSIGVPFEGAWLDRIASANKDMWIVDTARNIHRIAITDHGHNNNTGVDADEEPENADPHIWLSPMLVATQAQTIFETLAALDPDHQDEYAANLEAFLRDIDELKASISETLETVESHQFMVFHPAWGYFADEFGLEMIPVEIGGQEPSAKELVELIKTAKSNNIKVIFAQPEFSTRAAETIADEIGGRVLLISPLAPDWLENLQSVAEAFAEVLDE
jgi:zinc transport system substrate-binding protein